MTRPFHFLMLLLGVLAPLREAWARVVDRLRVAAEAFEKELAAHSRPIGHPEGDDKEKAEPEAKTQKNPGK